MSTNEAHTDTHNEAAQNASHSYTNGNKNGYTNGNTNGHTNGNAPAHKEFERLTRDMTHEEKQVAMHASRFGYGPLAHMKTNDNNSSLLPAFGGEFQPGLYKGVENRKFANPAPLGLCAFALTTFVLSLINLGTRGITEPNIVVALAYGYGGLVQLLAGMWEMAVGNTFGATALSSYGGFWISFGIILTPGGFAIASTLEETSTFVFDTSFSFYLFGWFIFTFLLLLCTLKSTVAFFFLFFTLDLAFLFLALGYYFATAGVPQHGLQIAGGVFGILAAFAAWYNALAGIADTSNSFFIIPVAHFPWSAQGRAKRVKSNEHRV